MVSDMNEASKVDFSKMREDLKQRLGDREERKVRKEFEDARGSIEGEIEGMVPNMKVRDVSIVFVIFVFTCSHSGTLQ
jgi:hypothetical protein